jgi:hypothetical protein
MRLRNELKHIQPKPRKHQGDISRGSFSVIHGLRTRLLPQDTTVGGLPAFKELSTEESTFLTEPSEIFEQLFGYQPNNTELGAFHSFVGLLGLLKKNQKNLHIIKDIRDRFVELLWNREYGSGQELDRDSWEVDLESKVSAIQKFGQYFPMLAYSKIKLLDLTSKYYGMYGERYADHG